MNIGLLLPSLLMAPRFADRIFAPKELFLQLADGLVAKGHTVYVYSTSNIKTRAHVISGPQIFEEQTLSSVRVRQQYADYVLFKLNYTEYELDITTKAYEHAQSHAVSIMHSYHDPIAHYICPLSSIPTIYTLHDPLFPKGTIEGWRFTRFAKDAYIAISKSQAKLFEQHVRVIGAVHHGIDAEKWSWSEDAQEYLVFIGRIIQEKGIEDAFIVSECLNNPLHLATSDNYMSTPYYQQYVKPKLNNPLFTVAGFLTGEAKNAWIKHALALLFPIHWEESFGMVMIEAMVCGTPVIAYNRGSVPEIVVDGVTGFIIDPPEGDETPYPLGKQMIKKRGVEGLCEAVERLKSMGADRYRAMRRSCRRHVEEHFTVAQMVEGYEQVYKKVLASK